MADSRALGVFDSGVGGLTVVRALNRLLPAESIVYLGDTARVPYGNKSREAVLRFAREDCQFLLSRDVKAIVVACNTATAFAVEKLQKELDLPVIGVIEPGVEAALERSVHHRIGIIGTTGTVGSGAYQEAIRQRCPSAEILAHATPLLVPLIEENWLDHDASRMIVREYLKPFLEAGSDTLVLACTHYPLVAKILEEEADGVLQLVDSATTCASHTCAILQEKGLLNASEAPGTISPCLTDWSEHFSRLAERFLEQPLSEPERVSIDGSEKTTPKH